MSKNKKNRVRKITEEEYTKYLEELRSRQENEAISEKK